MIFVVDFNNFMFRTALGMKLKDLREQNGISVETMSDRLGLSADDVENGVCCDESLVNRYLDACGCSGKDVIHDTELVMKIFDLSCLLEEFLNDDLDVHGQALALSEVICKVVRMDRPSLTVDQEIDMINRICIGLKEDMDTCSLCSDRIPEVGTIPIEDDAVCLESQSGEVLVSDDFVDEIEGVE